MYFSRRSLVREIRFSCAGYFEGYGFFRIEDSCVIDSTSDVSVRVLFLYISVGCVIVMEVGDVELGLGYLYYLFIYMYGIPMGSHFTRLSIMSSKVRKKEGDHMCLPLLYPM